MCSILDDYKYYDIWNYVIWSDCYDHTEKLIQLEWNGNIFNIPWNAEYKLEKLYGNDWRIPQPNKGIVGKYRKEYVI